ncbi:MAG: hypothetical protein V4719_00120 [Planctomycetota bacterium]
MELPASLMVYQFAYALDCGTTLLQATDEIGRQHTVMLVQHSFPQLSPSLTYLPGRLYFDNELVPIRSDMEMRVLALLRAAEVRFSVPLLGEVESIQLSRNAPILSEDIRQVLTRSPEDNIRSVLAALVEFVESEAYLRFAERVEQAADTTRYNVWVAWERGTRNQVIVRLGRVLGKGLQSARQLLDSGAPLTEDATALEVSEIADRYSAEGLSLRVEPAFRWRSV